MSNLTDTFRVFFPSSFRGSGLIAAFAFLICLFAAQSVQAQLTLTVTRTDDRNATCVSGVDCSLREAVNAANAAATNDTINFAIPAGDAGCTAGVCTITLASNLGELTVNSAATAGTLLITNSTGASNLLISGNSQTRVLFVDTGANLTINGITITRGNGLGNNFNLFGYGGGIYNNGGTLTLSNSTVSSSSAGTSGGGIYNNGGTTILTNSTASGNSGGFSGGGITNNGGTLTLINSTVSNNGATVRGGNGGGGIHSFGTTTLTNSTVSSNTAATGGGITIRNGTLNLTSVTVTRNSSTFTSGNWAGGITNDFGTANLKNTIVAGNTNAFASGPPDFRDAVAAGSAYNLIGIGQGTNGQGATGISNNDANHNQVGSSASPIDPKLNPALQPNNGATPNHALLPGSPAIDKGNSFGLITDQRGLTRPIDFASIPNATGGDGSDIGAFEATAPTAATVFICGQVAARNGFYRQSRALVTLTDQFGQSQTIYVRRSGEFCFQDVEAGGTYILTARAKGSSYAPQVVNATENVNKIIFEPVD